MVGNPKFNAVIKRLLEAYCFIPLESAVIRQQLQPAEACSKLTFDQATKFTLDKCCDGDGYCCNRFRPSLEVQINISDTLVVRGQSCSIGASDEIFVS